MLSSLAQAMPTNLPAPVIGAFITALAALAVAAYNTYRTWKLRRDELTLALCSRFFSKDMFVVRAECWKAAKKWLEGNDPDLLSHFIVPEQPFSSPATASSALGANQLDSASNVSVLLHFFAELAVYSDLGLLNEAAIKEFFGDIYEWWAPFMRAFAEEYIREAGTLAAKPVTPSWVNSVYRLDKMFMPRMIPSAWRQKASIPKAASGAMPGRPADRR